MVGAPGGSPAEALVEVRLRATRFHLRHFVASADRSVDSRRGYESEGWAHFAFTRINITPTILRKKIEELREAGATLVNAAAFIRTNSRSIRRKARG